MLAALRPELALQQTPGLVVKCFQPSDGSMAVRTESNGKGWAPGGPMHAGVDRKIAIYSAETTEVPGRGSS